MKSDKWLWAKIIPGFSTTLSMKSVPGAVSGWSGLWGGILSGARPFPSPGLETEDCGRSFSGRSKDSQSTRAPWRRPRACKRITSVFLSISQSAASQGLGLWSSGSKEIGGNLWWDIAMQLYFDSAWLSDVNIPTLDQRLSWLSSMFLLAESVWYDIVFALIWQSGWDSDARALARGEEGWGKKELLAPNPPGHHQAPPDQRQPRQPDPRALGGDERDQALQPHPRAHRPVLWQGLGGGGRCWQRDPPHQSGHRAWGSKVGWSI